MSESYKKVDQAQNSRVDQFEYYLGPGAAVVGYIITKVFQVAGGSGRFPGGFRRFFQESGPIIH